MRAFSYLTLLTNEFKLMARESLESMEGEEGCSYVINLETEFIEVSNINPLKL